MYLEINMLLSLTVLYKYGFRSIVLYCRMHIYVNVILTTSTPIDFHLMDTKPFLQWSSLFQINTWWNNYYFYFHHTYTKTKSNQQVIPGSKRKLWNWSQSRPLRHLVDLDIKPQCQKSSARVSFQHPLTFSKRPSTVLYRPAYTIHEIHNRENIISLYSNYIYLHVTPGNE